ncbi:MAG: alpha/beta hydrolase [Candidatus Symbiobacter sp.]|nr:alpha/beta hydrolase [Candidatus Symbiobacter sp.]
MKKRNLIVTATLGVVLLVLAVAYGAHNLLSPKQPTEGRWSHLPTYAPMPKANQSGYADVNGIKMYYATYGAGEPILFIHGGLGHGDVWGDQVTEFMKTNLVIVADSRGHGRSTRNEQSFGYDLMASDYLALLDQLKIDRVDVVGWSDGGIIGIDMAMSHPERLRHVFAHAANVTVDGVNPKVMENPTFKNYIERSGEDYRKMSKTPNEYDAFVAQIGKMWETQPNWSAEMLGKITVPIAIVFGEYDEAVLRDHTEKMAQMIPGSKLVILKDVSHFAAVQDPESYNAAIRELVSAK